jgi:hypothetical protein
VYPLLAGVSVVVMVVTGTMATICLEAGMCQDAMFILPFFFAGIGGIAASAIKTRG